MTEISIIVPIYNAEKYLCETIQSIFKQTFINFELICVNDGSKDKSLQILNFFKRIDKRIVILNQENQGVSMARNNAIAVAKGKYIAFLDADDLMHPLFLEKMYQTIRQENSDIVYCDYKIVSENFNQIDKTKKSKNKTGINANFFVL